MESNANCRAVHAQRAEQGHANYQYTMKIRLEIIDFHGTKRYPLADKVKAVPLSSLAAGRLLFDTKSSKRVRGSNLKFDKKVLKKSSIR